jgi:hypothetical protein
MLMGLQGEAKRVKESSIVWQHGNCRLTSITRA